jgi:hypothetical protein
MLANLFSPCRFHRRGGAGARRKFSPPLAILAILLISVHQRKSAATKVLFPDVLITRDHPILIRLIRVHS